MKQITLSSYCEKHSLTEDEVRQKIKNKEIAGRPKMGVWYVDVDDASDVDDCVVLKQPYTIQTKNHTPRQLIALSTLDYLSGKELSEVGLVSASSVQSTNIIKSLGAELKSQTIGGKSKTLSDLMDKTREDLLTDLQGKAHGLKADAVIGIRFTTSEVLGRGIELMVYGTAVKIAYNE